MSSNRELPVFCLCRPSVIAALTTAFHCSSDIHRSACSIFSNASISRGSGRLADLKCGTTNGYALLERIFATLSIIPSKVAGFMLHEDIVDLAQ